MPITISGSTGISGVDGTVSSPAVQGADTNTGIYYPAADQVAIATNGVQRFLVGATGVVTTGVGALYPLVSGTAVASTSGTSIDFTGLPSWVKRVTIMLRGVSTSGASDVIFQLGSSAGFVITNYEGSSSTIAATVNSSLLTSGFLIRAGSGASAAFVREGAIVLSLLSSNTWSGSLNCSMSHGALTCVASGSVDLPGALDRVRITTVGGTDTFDAGFINILYEG